ncbi:MAG: toxin-antitoxin system protein [Deltaproteobacteria bacterium]|nr:toxin-antitoxin system protein [Deltaproteobacteria bacterium]
MRAASIQLSAKGQRLVTELARECRKPVGEVIDAALETYRRERFVRKANADLARLRRDKKAWAAYQRELSEWDATLNDGLAGLD